MSHDVDYAVSYGRTFGHPHAGKIYRQAAAESDW
jgi:hypothetical protein